MAEFNGEEQLISSGGLNFGNIDDAANYTIKKLTVNGGVIYNLQEQVTAVSATATAALAAAAAAQATANEALGVETGPESAHFFYGGPTAGNAAPTFRALTVSDLPVVDVAHGGTGQAAAGGAALDAISGLSGTGFVYRNSAASYIIETPPIIIGVGGTGLSGITNHALIVGGPGNAMSVLGLGTAGWILGSNGGAADPSFQTKATLGIAVSGANSDITSLTALTTVPAIVAAVAGSATQNFSVKDATSANQAVAYDQVYGLGQSWQLFIGSRAFGTVYTNATNRPIDVSVTGVTSTTAAGLSLTVNSIQASVASAPVGGSCLVFGTVPAGASYEVSVTFGTITLNSWSELR